MAAGRRPTQQRAGDLSGAPGPLLCQEAEVSPCAPGRRPQRASSKSMTSSASTIDRRHTAGTPWRSSSVIVSGARRRCSEMRRPHCVCRPKMRFIADARIRTRCIRRRSRSRSARSSSDGIHSSGTKSRRASSANTRASTLSVLHASGATSTGRPPESESPVSWSGAPQGPGKVAVCTNARTCLSLNLAPCLDQRGRVAPGTTWGHWTNRDESRLCRGPALNPDTIRPTGELAAAVHAGCAPAALWPLACRTRLWGRTLGL